MMDNATSEFRRDPRRAVLRDAKISLHGIEGAGRSMPGILHDISRRGIGLSCGLKLAAGEVFTVILDLGDGQQPRLECRVVHSYPVTDGWWAVGAEFSQDPVLET
jgi:hypothetical protein